MPRTPPGGLQRTLPAVLPLLLCRLLVTKWLQNPVVQKWPAKMSFIYRIALPLIFAKCLVAIEPINKKLVAGQKCCQFLKTLFGLGNIF